MHWCTVTTTYLIGPQRRRSAHPFLERQSFGSTELPLWRNSNGYDLACFREIKIDELAICCREFAAEYLEATNTATQLSFDADA